MGEQSLNLEDEIRVINYEIAMKILKQSSLQFIILGSLSLALAGCSTTLSPDQEAKFSHDGLERVTENTSADVVYVRPGIDLSTYTKVMLEEPEVAFRKYWQQNYNMDHPLTLRLSDEDVEKLREEGQRLFMEAFSEGLEKGGFTIVDEPGEDVLLVKPSLTDLYMVAPDPDNRLGVWTKVYAESFGDMTLYLELYDSVTHQILVRAQDERRDIGEGAGSWRIPRNRVTNIADARRVFHEWANMFVKGFQRAREVGAGN